MIGDGWWWLVVSMMWWLIIGPNGWRIMVVMMLLLMAFLVGKLMALIIALNPGSSDSNDVTIEPWWLVSWWPCFRTVNSWLIVGESCAWLRSWWGMTRNRLLRLAWHHQIRSPKASGCSSPGSDQQPWDAKPKVFWETEMRLISTMIIRLMVSMMLIMICNVTWFWFKHDVCIWQRWLN